MIAALERMPEVRILKRTNVFGYYDHNCLGALEKLSDGAPGEGEIRQRRHVIRARQVVLATGATERLIAFPGNDRPGVMMAGAALVYPRRFGVAPGRRAVIFTNNDSAYATARALKAAGLERVVVVDARAKGPEAGGLDVRLAREVAAFDGRRVEVRHDAVVQKRRGDGCADLPSRMRGTSLGAICGTRHGRLASSASGAIDLHGRGRSSSASCANQGLAVAHRYHPKAGKDAWTRPSRGGAHGALRRRNLRRLEFYEQTVWSELDLVFCSVTDEWAQMSVAGPRSRETLMKIVTGLDLSTAAFPFMAASERAIGSAPAQIFRISFSGELAYEVAAPSSFAAPIWEAILTAGREFGITPYGLEAMGVLRIEKSHPAGAELGGFTTAADLGLGRMTKKTGDFVGRVLAGRPALVDPRRPRLTGIRALGKAHRLRGGAHLVAESDSGESLGYVTSVTRSFELGQWIGLALIEEAESRRDKRLWALSPLHDERAEVVVTRPCFVDPENARVRA